MEISTRDLGGIKIFELRGRLNMDSAPFLRDAVYEALESGSTGLLISLAEVSSVDSTGVGQIVACRTSARNRGGQLKLMQPSPKVADILAITELDKILEVFHDEDEAVTSFARTQ